MSNTSQGYQTQGAYTPMMGSQGTGYQTLPYQVPPGTNSAGTYPGYSAQNSSPYGSMATPMGPATAVNWQSIMGPNGIDFSRAPNPYVSGPLIYPGYMGDFMAGQGQGSPITRGLTPPRMMDTGPTFGSQITNPAMNPMARPVGDFGPLPPGQANPYLGNKPGQNGLVYTNGQFGFGSGSPVQLPAQTASMLGLRNNGQGQWVNAQGQVVGLV